MGTSLAPVSRSAIRPAPSVTGTDPNEVPVVFQAVDTGKATRYFQAAADGYRVLVRPSGMNMQLRTEEVAAGSTISYSATPWGRGGAWQRRRQPIRWRPVEVEFIGARADRVAVPGNALTGTANYFVGSDPAAWRTGISLFRRVTYRQIYEGIHVQFHSRGRQVEYDFVVEPGGDPANIEVAFRPAQAIELGKSGDLTIFTHQWVLRQPRPLAWQVGEEEGISWVPVAYRLNAEQNGVGFQVGEYDRTRPLRIDPLLSYATFFGGLGADQGWDVVVDEAGSALVVGEMDSAGFAEGEGGLPQWRHGGGDDAFLAKFAPDGAELIYFAYIGGSGDDGALALTLDGDGNPVFTGFSSSPDFPVVDGFQSDIAGVADDTGVFPFDAVAVRMRADGEAILYSTYLGGTGEDEALDLTVASNGTIYLAGQTTSMDFPIWNTESSHSGGEDVFVAKFMPTGADPDFTILVGGKDDDSGEGIAVDSQGRVVVGGFTYSRDFPVQNAWQDRSDGFSDAFLFQLDAAASGFLYSTYFGGSDLDRISRILLDDTDRIVCVGQTFSSDFDVQSALQDSLDGASDAFLTRFLPGAAGLDFSTYFGGSASDSAWDVQLAASGDIEITGNTDSPDFTLVRAYQSNLSGVEDVFYLRLNAAGTAIEASTYVGGDGIDNAFGLGVAGDGTVHLTGFTSSVAGLATPGAFQDQNGGGLTDGFLVRLVPELRLRTLLEEGQWRLEWPVTQMEYNLEHNANLGLSESWMPVGGNVSKQNGLFSYPVPSPTPVEFYRLIVQP